MSCHPAALTQKATRKQEEWSVVPAPQVCRGDAGCLICSISELPRDRTWAYGFENLQDNKYKEVKATDQPGNNDMTILSSLLLNCLMSQANYRSSYKCGGAIIPA